MECVNCGKNEKLISVEGLMNRGGRSGVMCLDCFNKMSGHGGKISVNDNDSKPVLKDIKNAYSCLVKNPTASVLAELAKHGCDISKVAGNTPRVFFPVKTRLNSLVRYAESLRKLEEREGVRFSSFRLILESESHEARKVYECDDLAKWADFARQSEDDFCALIGCPQWSALRTGTRKH